MNVRQLAQNTAISTETRDALFYVYRAIDHRYGRESLQSKCGHEQQLRYFSTAVNLGIVLG